MAELGCAFATVVLESVGTQEYKLVPGDLAARSDRTCGRAAAAEPEALLAGVA
ncbi:hypothetical protein [Streptomyces sp. enrichment culture]|uniref:hypothetical protein n=1 Tax=Streptomyces sp. enrichment culture TaxID=1795815 RepID=UPI003F5674B9